MVAVNCVFLTLDDPIFTPDYPLIQSNPERFYTILSNPFESYLFVFVREHSPKKSILEFTRDCIETFDRIKTRVNKYIYLDKWCLV